MTVSRALHHGGRQQFERDDAVHRAVERFEDEPHPARVERVEDHVIVDEQRILRRLQQYGRLVPRQFSLTDQFGGDFARLARQGAVVETLAQLLDFVARQEAALKDRRGEFLGRQMRGRKLGVVQRRAARIGRRGGGR